MSFVDLLEDDYERNRLNKYIDWGGIKDFDDFKARVREAFGTPQGAALLKAASDDALRRWYKNEGHRIKEFSKTEPLVGKRQRFGRDYFLGTNKRGDIFIVKKVSVKNRYGRELSRYRDSKGMFSSLKPSGEFKDKATGRFVSNFNPEEVTWLKGKGRGDLSSRKAPGSKGHLRTKNSVQVKTKDKKGDMRSSSERDEE